MLGGVVFQQVAEILILSRLSSQTEKRRPTDFARNGRLRRNWCFFPRNDKISILCRSEWRFYRRSNPRRTSRRLGSGSGRKAQFGGAHPAIAMLREILIAAFFTLHEHGYWHKNIRLWMACWRFRLVDSTEHGFREIKRHSRASICLKT